MTEMWKNQSAFEVEDTQEQTDELYRRSLGNYSNGCRSSAVPNVKDWQLDPKTLWVEIG